MRTVTVADMANARDRRAGNQRRMLERFRRPVVSFTLNIPGPEKVFPGTKDAYFFACRQIRGALACDRLPILGQLETLAFTGYEMIYSVDGEAARIKRLMVQIEDAGALGRLCDIDVIAPDGSGLSRTDLGLDARRCLLCSRPARECARSRAHTVDELLTHVRAVLKESGFPAALCDARMENLAIRSLLGEVEATPKPGLVDLRDSGSHTDMDYGVFAASAYAIAPYLAEMYRAGFTHAGDAPSLFPKIRAVGTQAEAAMFAATGGVNTHKGAIFSMGILMAACGLCGARALPTRAETILDLASRIAGPAIRRDLEEMKKRPPKTHGERLYALYGSTGIRGEVLGAFPSVRNLSLPALRRANEESRALPDADGARKNRILLNALLALMSEVQDTNILIRSDMETLSLVHREARSLLEAGGALAPDGIRRLEQMNDSFIQKNISPGGCADLLAITLFLYELESDPL